jgi:hypothetical protein
MIHIIEYDTLKNCNSLDIDTKVKTPNILHWPLQMHVNKDLCEPNLKHTDLIVN